MTYRPTALICALLLATTTGCGGGERTQSGSSVTTTRAGQQEDGVVCKRSSSQTPFTVVHAFTGADGANPWGSLTAMPDGLAGRTRVGGKAGQGVVFRVGYDGGGYEVLHEWEPGADNGTGRQPHHDSLLLEGTRLIGATKVGGEHDGGVVFGIGTDGKDYEVLHVLAGEPGDGAQPHSNPRLVDGRLLLLTAKGGAGGKGALVSISPGAAGPATLLYSFEKAAGDEPHGALLLGPDGRTLFGMTRKGGAHGHGVVFSIQPDGQGFAALHEFAGGDADGAQPDHGNLVLVEGWLFGMTSYGGPADAGVVFRVRPDGSGYEVLHEFGAGRDGKRPKGTLTLHEGMLYGTTFLGGDHGVGTVFALAADGTGYRSLASFDGASSGATPFDNVAFGPDGATMYGMAGAGGPHDPDCTLGLGTVWALPLRPGAS